MAHKLEIEELRPGELKARGEVTKTGERSAVYYYCRCGGWWGTGETLHRRTIYDQFFVHLDTEHEERADRERESYRFRGSV